MRGRRLQACAHSGVLIRLYVADGITDAVQGAVNDTQFSAVICTVGHVFRCSLTIVNRLSVGRRGNFTVVPGPVVAAHVRTVGHVFRCSLTIVNRLSVGRRGNFTVVPGPVIAAHVRRRHDVIQTTIGLTHRTHLLNLQGGGLRNFRILQQLGFLVLQNRFRLERSLILGRKRYHRVRNDPAENDTHDPGRFQHFVGLALLIILLHSDSST